MASEEINLYYDSTEDSDVRPELVRATDLVLHRFEHISNKAEGKTAIKTDIRATDCGCGAGSDIAYLRSRAIEVFAFDVEEEAVQRCCKRFKGDPHAHITQASFSSYQYPKSHLVVADASLFFCPPADFDNVWQSIVDSLEVGGVFVGSFLGTKDTMATAEFDGEAFWPEVTTFTTEVLESRFASFKILDWVEHELDGKTAQGVDHHWHIFSVTAEKLRRE